ncbi:MAG: hypothetical protein ACI9CF_000366 [Candidatus Omnitrophota bacterium]|jgi:hypothetical protein
MYYFLQKRLHYFVSISILVFSIVGCASVRQLNSGMPPNYTISDFSKPSIHANMSREEVHALLAKPQYTAEFESGLEDEWVIIDPGTKFDKNHLLKRTANFLSAGIYALFTEPHKKDTGRKIQTIIRIRYNSEHKVTQALFN